MEISIAELGTLMIRKRGTRGVRAAAEEVGISSATFSRIENGNMPDLATFAKICSWLGRDPNEFLRIEGVAAARSEDGAPQVHLRKKRTVSRETAESLGALILAVQEAARAHNELLS